MKVLFLLPIGAALAACGSSRPSATVAMQTMPPAMAGASLAETESVRSGEALKAYPVGRYADPGNPGVMHEGHSIYRVEQGPRWNLNPHAPVSVPLGPTVAVSDPAQQLSPVAAELEQRIEQQNRLIAAAIEQNDRLSEEIQKLQDEQARTREDAAERERLQQELAQKEHDLAESRKREAAPSPPPAPEPAPSWWEKVRRRFQPQPERK
jgi:hypothetical protein